MIVRSKGPHAIQVCWSPGHLRREQYVHRGLSVRDQLGNSIVHEAAQLAPASGLSVNKRRTLD
eukprot:8667661-Alexandrium_andersonii.AAC.1